MTSRLWPAALLCVMAMVSCDAERGQSDSERADRAPPPAAAPDAGERAAEPSATDSASADSAGVAAPVADSGATAGPMIHPPRDSATAEAVAPGETMPGGAMADTSTWTAGETFAPPTVVGYAPLPVLTEVRTGTHPEYDRLTVELGDTEGLPSYHLEYLDRPLHECGSGREINPVGDAWLELRLEPAAAHTEAGAPTLGAREIDVGAPLLRRIYRTCDFEGVVTFVLALSAPNQFRVLTLSDPSRIVVDVQR